MKKVVALYGFYLLLMVVSQSCRTFNCRTSDNQAFEETIEVRFDN